MTVLRGKAAKAGRTLALLAMAGAVLGLALAAAGRVSPHADIASHFTGHLIGAFIGGALALAARRHQIAILAAGDALTILLHALLAWSGGMPITGNGAHASGQAGNALKVVSLNTWHANTQLSAIAELIEREDAGIVLLYETGPEKSALLDRLRRLYPHVNGCHDDWRCSVVILSKSKPGHVEIGGHGHHDGAPRVMLRFGEGATSLTVIGAHLARPIDGARRNWRELEQLADLARAAPGLAILAGDLNSTPWSQGFARFRERSRLGHMGAFLPSWPAGGRGLPQLAIDHIWASPAIAFEDVALGGDVGSDHLPLIARLRLPAGVTGY